MFFVLFGVVLSLIYGSRYNAISQAELSRIDLELKHRRRSPMKKLLLRIAGFTVLACALGGMFLMALIDHCDSL